MMLMNYSYFAYLITMLGSTLTGLFLAQIWGFWGDYTLHGRNIK